MALKAAADAEMRLKIMERQERVIEIKAEELEAMKIREKFLKRRLFWRTAEVWVLRATGIYLLISLVSK